MLKIYLCLRYERSGERTTCATVTATVLDTRWISSAAHPEAASESYFPPFLETLKISEKALIAVIQEAWICGVSTLLVYELVQAMGCR